MLLRLPALVLSRPRPARRGGGGRHPGTRRDVAFQRERSRRTGCFVSAALMRRRPQRGRSRLNAANGPEPADIDRSVLSESRDRSRLKDPRGVRNQRASRHDTNMP